MTRTLTRPAALTADRISDMNRRTLLKGSIALGAGLMIAFHIPAKKAFAQEAGGIPKNFDPAGYMHIGEDGTITVISKHTEMGQGIYTGLATMVAEELDADWNRVRVVSAPVNLALYAHFMLPGMQGTGGSMSTPNSWYQYRTVGATARAMLVTAAANAWGVPEAEIEAKNSILSHKSGKSAQYGEFAMAAARLTPPTDVPLKDPETFTLIGRDAAKVDAEAKSTGEALFTIDVKRPGMMTAVVARSPRWGGKLKSFDDTGARKIKGVTDIVEIPTGVAVLAKNTWVAQKARNALKIEWDDSNAEMRGDEEIIADYMELGTKKGAVVEDKGNVDQALEAGAKTFEADFVFPYLAHSPMEPLDSSMELMEDGTYVIRSGTQMPSIERDRVAEYFGVPKDKVHVENLFAGGGFGRRGNFVPELEVETASILKATGAKYPVKLQLTREDDTMQGYYRPLFVHRMKGAIDAKGNITAWRNTLVGQSFVIGTFLEMMVQNGVDPLAVEGAAHLPYDIPNVYVDYQMAKSGVPCLSWRSVGATHTGYSKEVFMDQLLKAAGRDPVQGRLEMMSDERAKRVIELAAEKSGWGRPVPAGIGRGIAYVEAFSTRVAQVADVSMRPNGTLKVERVVAAVDCGIALNPNVIRAQIQSGIAMGLTAAMYGEIKIKDGIAETRNFDTYRILRMNEMPEVEVHIVKSGESPTGIGEPGVPPIGPAVANAAQQLTGKHVYRLPFDRRV